MDDDIAIKVQGVSKTFKDQAGSKTIKNSFIGLGRKIAGKPEHHKKKGFTALKNINFEVKRGEFFGIVGRNGCGKSTLLKIMAGVYTPTKGAVLVNGKLTPFIELGVGFNPELSGRDNVFLNGALLGFSRKQMEAMYKDIVDFAELHEFMDMKLKNYSSGMQVRLAFSVAIRAKSDILLIDEVLAVGDEAFQQKCLDIFEKYKTNKQTVVLVTHDMGIIKRFCDKALLINEGRVNGYGDRVMIANKYSKLNQQKIDSADSGKAPRKSKIKTKYLVAKVQDEQSLDKKRFIVGDTMRVRIKYDESISYNIESIGVTIIKQSGEHITGINSRGDKNIKFGKLNNSLIDLNIVLNIKPGKYAIMVEMFSAPGKLIDAILDGPHFIVSEDSELTWSGLVELPHNWQISNNLENKV